MRLGQPCLFIFTSQSVSISLAVGGQGGDIGSIIPWPNFFSAASRPEMNELFSGFSCVTDDHLELTLVEVILLGLTGGSLLVVHFDGG